jgi:general nucleoside transport system permease protein
MAFIISILAAAVVYAVSILYATIGEIFSQRAGVMNLGLEGIMLMGAVSGYITVVHTHSLALSMLVVIIVGLLLGLLYSFLTVTLKANQIVCGLAILTFGMGLSGFLGKSVSGVSANLKFESYPLPVLSKIPILGDVFFNQDLLVYIMYLIIPLSIFYIYRTKYGMRLRALGENPAALDVEGINVFALRYAYVIFGCIMTTISGAYLSLAYTNFWSEGMTGGRGWIAAALVTFASWKPRAAVWGALLFGGISIIGTNLQIYLPVIPSQFFSMFPYLATIIVLILASGKFKNSKKHTEEPASLCIPYEREGR